MFSAGQSIGNYRVLSKIGTGGMGAVYLAEHPLIGKKIALKVIHRELAGNREVVQRFFQEARAVNKIGNEHIVEIHDFGVTPEGDHFYIMEYLDGRTLAAVLATDRVLDVARALHIGAQIASALSAAHTSGVIHRDLKPDNIMLTPRHGDADFVKVLDFGLAKMFADHTSAVKTAVGVVLGTPQYMSPEACESKRDIDQRTDIYALGILLFQMMTGVLPFDGESMGEVLVKQVTQLPPPPRGINPAIPPSVEQILLRCLAKQVDGRFPTMQALREALLDPEAYLRGSPPIAPARSLAPGEARVDAKQLMMHAEAVGKAKTLGLPLPAPPRTQIGAAGAAGKMIGDPPPVPAAQPAQSGNLPNLAQPAQLKNNTMRIATPVGYSSRPPRKVWPIVLVLGLLLGLGGGAFAVAWFDGDPEAASAEGAASGGPSTGHASGTSAGSAAPTQATITSGSGKPGSAAPAGSASRGSTSTNDAGPTSDPGSATASAAMAKVTIDSVPPGATVTVNGNVVGTTPLKVEWPISSDPVRFELRLAGYRKKDKTLVVAGNIATQIPLERASGRDARHGAAEAGSDGTNGLERPD